MEKYLFFGKNYDMTILVEKEYQIPIRKDYFPIDTEFFTASNIGI